MDLDMLGKLDPGTLRALMPQFLSGFIRDADIAANNLARISEPISTWTDDDAQHVISTLVDIGREEMLYPANPLCSVVSRAWSRDLISSYTLEGVSHLEEAVKAGPTVILSNHAAYFDSSAIDAILAWEGREDLADRLVSAAGPKVYTDLFRRVAAACLNTLPVPQSTSFSHTAKLSARELARRAIRSLNTAGETLDKGYVLLLFPEGSRTRTGTMGSFLRAVHRYLGVRENVHVVPTALVGTGQIMPVGETLVSSAHVTLRFGQAIQVGVELPQREALVAVHAAINDLLPETSRAPESQAAIA